MDNVEFLGHCVDFQERMLKDAEEALAKVQTKYAKLDAHRITIDHEVANHADGVEKAKRDLEAAKAELLAAQDQDKAARANPGIDVAPEIIVEGDS